METIKRLTNEAAEILQQLNTGIKALDHQDYCLGLDVIEGNSIGMHVRHIIEFYQCLQQGMLKELIDYDARARNTILETSKSAAIDEIESIITWLLNIETEKEIKLLHHSQQEMVLYSSLSRELAFNLEHTVHHMAIIKICINTAFSSIKLDEKFGLAYATLQYRASTHVHSKLSA